MVEVRSSAEARQSGVNSMQDLSTRHFDVKSVDNIIVARLLDGTVRDPFHAEEIGRELEALLAATGPGRYVVDLGKTKYMSSSGFAILMNFARKAAASRSAVKVCNMHPDVRVGANIIRLGDVVPILDDEAAALDSFAG
jgi:anti-sigma B factor antagonist